MATLCCKPIITIMCKLAHRPTQKNKKINPCHYGARIKSKIMEDKPILFVGDLVAVHSKPIDCYKVDEISEDRTYVICIDGNDITHKIFMSELIYCQNKLITHLK